MRGPVVPSPGQTTLSVGIDVGGTFTDVVVFDSGSGATEVAKFPTSPDSADAIASWASSLGSRAPQVSIVAHATTVATNALLTRSALAKTCLLTNQGFRDILEIGRQRRPELYDLKTTRPPSLVRRRDRFTVRGRIAADGSVLEPLDEEGFFEAAATIVSRRFDSIAISLLNSYANPQHEEKARDLLRKRGFKGEICLSSEVDREYREYERTSTTVVNAALVSSVSKYLRRLENLLRRRGIRASLYVMNSNGGMSTVRFASARPVTIIESGPAAGVLASRRLARKLSLKRVLTFDMGGTTAKAGSIIGGEADLVEEFEAAGRTHSGRSIRGSGYPVRGSFIDLAEVSAGGGTIAWVDEGGALAVGPRSAGAVPGPACYGAGGKEPTITDANVTLGRLNPLHLLGGRMPIQAGLAEGALARLGRRMKTTPSRLAEAVVRLANNSMAKAINIVSVERGRDPRDFTLISFGGSGPVHSCDLAEDLGITDIIVPFHAGLFSAYGLLACDITRTFTAPAMKTGAALDRSFHELESSAVKRMAKEGLAGFKLERFVEVRYVGQSHELLLRYEGDSTLRRTFDRRHAEVYGYPTNDEMEIVNLRVVATVPRGFVPDLSGGNAGPEQQTEFRDAWFGGSTATASVHRRESLPKGRAGKGPCIIEDYDSTIVVNPGWEWDVETYGTRLRR